MDVAVRARSAEHAPRSAKTYGRTRARLGPSGTISVSKRLGAPLASPSPSSPRTTTSSSTAAARSSSSTAPVIKLPETATEDDHLALLGVLNSSTACFWLKQVSHNKGNGGVGGASPTRSGSASSSSPARSLSSSRCRHDCPLERAPAGPAGARSRRGRRPASVVPAWVTDGGVVSARCLTDAAESWARIRARDDLPAGGARLGDLPALRPGRCGPTLRGMRSSTSSAG